MTCLHCGSDNPAGKKFCGDCGAALENRCPHCGADNPTGKRFCGDCGAELQGSGVGSRGTVTSLPTDPRPPTPDPSAVSRKVISVVFADLMGSTALQERLDPESVNRVMDAYYQAVRGPVEAAGGRVVQLLGDGVFCAFGIPQIAEDDALRAVRAAVGVQQAFREFVQAQQWLNVSIGLRVAVNTGEVVVSDEHPAGIGDPLNVAARLQQEACDGEVLIGQATRRLVTESVTLERAGVFALKGRAETVTAYRVVSLERPKGATTRFVGRDEELARLTAVYEAAVAEPAAKLAVLLGSPGLGKSRLIEEVCRRLGDQASIMAAQCGAAGGATFAPVAEALREFLSNRSDRSDPTDQSDQQSAIAAALAGDAADRARIAAGISALLAGSPASPEETFFVIRRFLAALARGRPVVLVIDDLQWAEPLLLDLVEHLIQWGNGVPLLVLVGTRPELRDRRSSLATVGGFVADVVTLSGLDAGAAMRLAANVVGAADLPAAVAAKVLATSEGNPLFVGELVRMLVDQGAIERLGDRWIVGANLAGLEMPPTIHALLAARIERLPPEERTVLERAAVVGRHFSRSAVAALWERNDGELDARLEALRRTELIEPDSGWLLGEPVLRFHHVLIRDAAYRRLLKGTRAEMHERLANWIEGQVKDAPDHDESIGWHLEQAHKLLSELGPIEANGRTLGERAAQRLSAAGRRALARDDVPVAADLLGRAIDRLDADDPARADLVLDWCEALLSAGDVGAAAKAIEELAKSSDPTDQTDPSDRSDPNLRLRAWHTCFIGQLTVMTAPQELQTTADAVAQAGEDFARLGDAAGEAKAHSVHAQALARLGKVGACEAALDKALAAARRAGDRRRANAVLAGAPLAALWGPSPVTRASGRCLDVVRVLRITQGAPAVEAVALSCQGVLEALRGRTDAARRMIASSRKMVEELGIAHRLFEADVFAGRIDLLEGDAAAAERTLRNAYDGLRELGLGIDAARAGALLARALLVRGEVEEAISLSHESEALAGDDLQAAIAWRGVRAEALAKRGEHTAAIELAQAAVTIAAATDALLDHADARLALAAALRAAGRTNEADAEQHRATELWETKGATFLAERARGAEELPRSLGSSQNRVEPSPSTERRVRSNAATAVVREFDAAFAARNLDVVAALHAESFEEIDHLTEVTYGLEGLLATLRRTLRSHDPQLRSEALGTLGRHLILTRRSISTSRTSSGRFDVADAEREWLALTETEERGRIRRNESFFTKHLGDAIARLYQRYAEQLPLGPARDRASVTASAVAAMLTRSPEHRLEDVMAPDLEAVDHRTVGPLQGPDLLSRWRSTSDELVQGETFCIDDVLALSHDGLLRRTTQSGELRASGGAFETSSWGLSIFGPDGRQTRFEIFDVGHEAEALARFDELTGAQRRSNRRVRENAATAMIARFGDMAAARDVEALEDVASERLEVVHHPSATTYDRRGLLSTWRSLFRAESLTYLYEMLATLGDSLALHRQVWNAEGFVEEHLRSVGPMELGEICLTEIDTDGRVARFELFALERLGEAIARLHERYAELPRPKHASEQAATIGSAISALIGPPDVDVWSAFLAPEIEFVDHRTFGHLQQRGSERMRQYIATMAEMEQFTIRIEDVLALEPTACLARSVTTGIGRESGGLYERQMLQLWTFDAKGLLARLECFAVEREAEALARFEEVLVSEQAARKKERKDPFTNAATRFNERFCQAFSARDWDTVMALHPAPHRMEDRRRLMQMQLPVVTSMAQLRFLFDVPGSRFVVIPIATRGERLALSRILYEGEVDGGGGALELDYLGVDEVDADGHSVAVILFDTDDLDAAYAELDARWEAGEGAEHGATLALARALGRAGAARDWDAQLALCAPGFVFCDHRLLGWGQTMQDAAAWIRVRQALVELAPDVQIRADHHRFSARGWLQQVTQVGTREGGSFEMQWTTVIELDDRGRMSRLDAYDLDQLDEAQARFSDLSSITPRPRPFANAATRFNERFTRAWAARDCDTIEALRAGPAQDPLRIPPNAASAALDRIAAHLDAENWDALRALCKNMVFEDRRRLFLTTGDGAQFVTNSRFVWEGGMRPNYTLLATAGDRLALHRNLWRSINEEEAEVEALEVIEVDEDGRIVAAIIFEPDDHVAASKEIFERYAANGADGTAPELLEIMRAWNDHDLERLRASLPDDFYLDDRKRTGVGRLEGADAYVDSIAALYELSHDVRIDTLYSVSIAEHGRVWVARWSGTNKEGGEFDAVYAVVGVLRDGRPAGMEIFELDDLDAALARFEELRVLTHGA